MNNDLDAKTIIRLAGERDRARETAVALEQQVGTALMLHTPIDLGIGEDHAVTICPTCHVESPCSTAIALGADVFDDVD